MDNMEKETVDTVSEETVETTPEVDAEVSEVEALKAEIEKLKAEAKEKDDKYLRLAAEYDNFRRRSREEKEATYNNALADAITEILPIIDNLERAAQYDDGEKIKDGLVMIAGS